MNLIRSISFENNIDFLGLRRISLIASLILIIASMGLFLTRGLNLGIDFRGGVEVETLMKEVPDVAAFRAEVNALGIGEVGLQTFGDERDLLFTLQRQEGADDAAEAEASAAAIATLTAALGNRVEEIRRIETVGPTVSDELKGKAFWAMVYALLGIALYIAIRFEWRFSLAALAALTHDVITTIGLFALFALEFNLATVAAILTIAGYSINDTVVVFDRAREELRKYKQKTTAEVLNIALNRTLSRTIMTSVTTLLALLALTIFGGPVIRGFSIALIWGVVIGTYSSLFVATPLLLAFNLKRSTFDKKEVDPGEDGAAAFVQRLAEEEKEARRLSEKAAADFDMPEDEGEVIPPETTGAAKPKRKPRHKAKRKKK